VSSPISVTHHILKDGELAVEGLETRVWVGRDPGDPDKIKAKALPEEIGCRDPRRSERSPDR